MEFPHAFGFQIVNTPPCPQNSIIVNPPSPSEILKAVPGIVWIFTGIAHFEKKLYVIDNVLLVANQNNYDTNYKYKKQNVIFVH